MSRRNSQRALARRTGLAAALLLVTLTLEACDKQPVATPAVVAPATASTSLRNAQIEKNAVAIRNFAFEPATLTIAAGSKVTWTNRDDEPHRVVSDNGQFTASPALDTDDHYATVFAKAGTYGYYCSIHPHMVGKIIVK